MSGGPPPPVAAITGPTAAGKTALSLALSAHLPIEIVSADSMQVYRGLDVGTAKPSPQERAAVAHHLIDIASPAEKYDLARFLRDAIAAIDAIRSRGNIPLIVGGTGLYLRSLMTGIFAIPSRDPELRHRLAQRAQDEGSAALHEELRQADPPSARRISPNDAIRIVRALEVAHSTGKPMSYWHAHPGAPQTPAIPLRLVVLHLPRETLHQRIQHRVRAMLAQGWVEEVRALLAQGLPPDQHCFKALGYREIARRLVANEPMDGVEETIARETRQFAKRQMTWFRSMDNAHWMDLSNPPGQVIAEAKAILFPACS